MRNRLQRGQALLAVVLVMVVVLTVALSIAVKTITNLRTSSEDENSQRAFSAAEAGIEQALISNTNIAHTDLANNSSYSTTVSTLSGNSFLAKNGAILLKDEPIDVWLSTYPGFTSPTWSGNLTINWGFPGEICNNSENINTKAALEIIIISGSKATPQATHYLYDPCPTRATNNKFQAPVTPGSSMVGKNFANKTSAIPVTSGLIMRIIPLYATTVIGIEGDSSLPAQGTIATSVGVSDTTQRKIVSFRGFPKLPLELFPFIVFSPK